MKKLLLLALFAGTAFASSKYQSDCSRGGYHVQIIGINSPTYWLQTYPLCTITVYNYPSGTLATIYADSSNTPLANPFTADTFSHYAFYAANGHYNVRFSSGGILSAFTYTDILLNDGTGGGGGGSVSSVFSRTGAVVAVNGDYNFTQISGTVSSGQLPSAGGDLSGTLTNALIAKIQGFAVCATTPTSGYVFTWSGSQWCPAPSGGGGGAVSSFNTRTGAVTSQSGDYTTAMVAELTNLYYTDARARASVSATGTGISYDNTTGIFTGTGLTAAITSLNGLTAGTQTFSSGSTNIGFTSSSSTHTFIYTGPTAIGNGGTGQATASAAFNALSPQSTKGDLIAFSTLPVRVPIGADGFVLTADSTQTNGVKWAAGASGPTGTADQVYVIPHAGGTAVFGQVDLSQSAAVKNQTAIANGGTGQATASAAFGALSPNTTVGDLTGYNGSANVRVPVGADNTVLTADHTQAAGFRWGTSAAAGGVTLNTQTGGTYSLTSSNQGKLVYFTNSGGTAVTNTALSSNWIARLQATTAAVTFTPLSGTVNNNSNYVINANQAVDLQFDGTNFWVNGITIPVSLAGIGSTIPETDGSGNLTVAGNATYGTSGVQGCIAPYDTAGTPAAHNICAVPTGIALTGSGSNNAIVGALSSVTLTAGLCVNVKLAHTLQAGANTFNLNAGGAVGIKSHFNVSNNIGTAYANTGTVQLCYDGTEWVDASQ